MKAAPKKPDDLNGEHSRMWDMLAHVNDRIDNIFKWGFVVVVIIIASQWSSTIVLEAFGVGG